MEAKGPVEGDGSADTQFPRPPDGRTAMKRRRRERRSLKVEAVRAKLAEATTDLVAMADETQRVREQRAKPCPPTDDKAR